MYVWMCAGEQDGERCDGRKSSGTAMIQTVREIFNSLMFSWLSEFFNQKRTLSDVWEEALSPKTSAQHMLHPKYRRSSTGDAFFLCAAAA